MDDRSVWSLFSLIVDDLSLYTQPEDIYDIYKALSAVSPYFSIAAAFGNGEYPFKTPFLSLSDSQGVATCVSRAYLFFNPKDVS